MRALSIREPWASAIVYGPKRVENRGWRDDSIVGERIAIHAEIDDAGPEARHLCRQRGHDPDEVEERPGCIIGTARVAAIVTRREGDVWFRGPVGYVLEQVEHVAEPIPMPRQRRFWELPEAIAARLQG